MADSRDRYLELVDQLTEHDRRYYVDADPSISDVEYDKLSKQLKSLEDAHPDWRVAWSPTQRVGHAPTSDFPKVTRPVAMLSLDNSYNEEDLKAAPDLMAALRKTLEANGKKKKVPAKKKPAAKAKPAAKKAPRKKPAAKKKAAG